MERLAGPRAVLAAVQSPRALPAAGGAAQAEHRSSRALLALPHGDPVRSSTGDAALDLPTLRGLRDLGSSALMLGPGAGVAGDLALAQALPGLAGRLLQGTGLRAAAACRPVLEVDASSLPATGRDAQRAVERLLQEQEQRVRPSRQPRRVLLPAGPALALPPSDELDDSSGRQRLHSNSRLGGGGDVLEPHESLVVSVLLPANASVGPDLAKGPDLEGGASDALHGGPVLVDRLYVVVLQPRRRYVAYACNLAKPVLA